VYSRDIIEHILLYSLVDFCLLKPYSGSTRIIPFCIRKWIPFLLQHYSRNLIEFIFCFPLGLYNKQATPWTTKDQWSIPAEAEWLWWIVRRHHRNNMKTQSGAEFEWEAEINYLHKLYRTFYLPYHMHN
jgi:hypothetical protein